MTTGKLRSSLHRARLRAERAVVATVISVLAIVIETMLKRASRKDIAVEPERA